MFANVQEMLRLTWNRMPKAVLCGGIVLMAMAAGCQPSTDQAPANYQGNMPEGIWVLNQERSRKFMPGTHTLWVIKDDGRRLVWVSVDVDPEGNVRVSSWDGLYGGGAVEVKGTGMMSRVTSPEKGRIINSGEVPGLGSYAEDCTVMDKGRRMRCEFTLTTQEGANTYIDDFDWVSEDPMMFPVSNKAAD